MLAAGLVAGASAVVVYAGAGYSVTVFLLWLAALATLGVAFASRTVRLPRVAWQDVAAPGAIVLALTPLYVLNVHDWPIQVGSDEIAIMTVAERWAEQGNPDLFGLSDYLGHPVLLFVVWGKLGELFGGIDLGTMRALHGAVGLLAVAACYALFRQLLERRWAVVATLILGLSHSLFMISRLAMRENTALLVEATALALLLFGLRRSAPLLTFVGGVVAGLGYYVYQPARATIVIWIVFLCAVALLFKKELPRSRVINSGAIALGAFVLVAAPVVIAELKAPVEQAELSRSTLLVFDDARQLQREWVVADGTWEGLRTNVGYGLGAFNNNVVDHGWIYVNWGHGFVDPLVGVLLWVGVVVVGWSVVRRRDPWALLPLAGFLALWLSFAFVVNKAPNYTRLLITLPFVAYLVTQAIRALAEAVPGVLRTRGYPRSRLAVPLVAGVLVAAIAAWNVAIASDYVEHGRSTGDDIGSTGRYIEKLRDRPGMTFHMATSDEWPYYVWGFPWMWLERMRMFAHDGQVGDIVSPDRAGAFRARSPFILLMSRDLWHRAGSTLQHRYPRGRVEKVVPDGELVAFRMPRPAARSRP